MNRYLLMASLIVIMSARVLLADKIYTGTGAVIEGKITRITADSVEYTSGADTKGSVSRKEVERLVYDSGKEILFSDTIYLSDGSTVQSYIISVTESFIEYRLVDGSSPMERVEVAGVSKIIYRDGRTASFGKSLHDDSGDIIYFRDGKKAGARDIIVQKMDIGYTDDKSGIRVFYSKQLIEKIVYKDGRVERFDDPAVSVNEPGSPDGNTVRCFLEMEWGWNGYAGLGGRLDYRLIDGLSINGGAGVAIWGTRVSGGFRYYLDYPFGIAFGAGLSYTYAGNAEVKVDGYVTDGYADYKDTITYTYKNVLCANAGILLSFQVNGDDRIYVETGYSYALTKEKYTYKTVSGLPLAKSEKDVMDLMAPGGFMISIGYALAL